MSDHCKVHERFHPACPQCIAAKRNEDKNEAKVPAETKVQDNNSSDTDE